MDVAAILSIILEIYYLHNSRSCCVAVGFAIATGIILHIRYSCCSAVVRVHRSVCQSMVITVNYINSIQLIIPRSFNLRSFDLPEDNY